MRQQAWIVLALAGVLAGSAGLAAAESDAVDRVIQSGGPRFARALQQDEGQAMCSQYRDLLPDERVPAFLAAQRQLIRYPASGRLMGDWRQGEKLFGDSRKGNCYACHQGDPRELAAGNVGPPLTRYGLRGASEAVVRYTYEKIFNSWAYVPCSTMYRAGVHGVLTPDEVAHVVAYLLDPQSPLNAGGEAVGRR